MLIYPSIDILNGKVVRLRRGDFAQVAEYPGSPVDFAKRWRDAGAQFIHIVDLDGAISGEFKNFKYVEKIASEIQIPIQLGGGLRTAEQIETAIDLGIARVIVGTRAVDQGFVREMVQEFKDKIAVGMDVREGFVQTHGWKESTTIYQDDFLKKMEEMNVKYIIYTDISRDGMLQGPNTEGLSSVLKYRKLDVILSGGMSSLDDLQKVLAIKDSNFNGVIIGRALYENKIDLKKAIEIVNKTHHSLS